MIARVIVTPKPVVNDPQGITVRQGLASLGFREVTDVRVGKYIEVKLDASSQSEARQKVEAMCRQLLANQVIEDFRFEIVPDGDKHR
jgi:phosphoribosylformylglycinamidine synthase PurS subunit